MPVVIFLHPGGYPTRLDLGGDRHRYLQFHYLAYPLFQTPARDHFDSPNLVARLNLPNMAYASEDKIDVYAQAVRGLLDLEPDPERQLKYLDFIDIYAHLDDNERRVYQQRHAPETTIMSQFAERFEEKGRQEGRQEGEATILLHLLTLKFGSPNDAMRQRVQQADSETLLRWSARVLAAQSLEEIFAELSR